MKNSNLERFVEAQSQSYNEALGEIVNGRKRTHWIWFIFPQIKGLGRSYNSEYYGIESLEEAKAYLNHEILGAHLKEITNELLKHRDESIDIICGSRIDAMKLKSSMTLFDIVSPDGIYAEVLDVFYGGRKCHRTLHMLGL